MAGLYCVCDGEWILYCQEDTRECSGRKKGPWSPFSLHKAGKETKVTQIRVESSRGLQVRRKSIMSVAVGGKYKHIKYIYER